eukprot:g7807.t1
MNENEKNDVAKELQANSDASLWVIAHDPEHERDYYFNVETQEALWEKPEGLENCEFQRYEEVYPTSSKTVEESIPESTTMTEGWHYIDVNGNYQGPFQVNQLKEWRGSFPMNTLFWKTHELSDLNKKDISSNTNGTFLAKLIGDEELLEKWKNQTPDYVSKIAPSATAYEHYLKFPVALPIEEQFHEEGYPTEMSYADAVLAGLPADDETLHLADMARQSGQSIKDVVDFVHTAAADSSEYQMVVKDPYTGKMQVVANKADESKELYAEFGSWIDPAKMEEGLKKSAKYRREKLPAIWKRTIGVKKRKVPQDDD